MTLGGPYRPVARAWARCHWWPLGLYILGAVPRRHFVFRACHESGGVRRKKNSNRGNVVRLQPADPHRDGRRAVVPRLLRGGAFDLLPGFADALRQALLVAGESRVDEPRNDGVDRNPMLPELHRSGLHKAENAPFRRRVARGILSAML